MSRPYTAVSGEAPHWPAFLAGARILARLLWPRPCPTHEVAMPRLARPVPSLIALCLIAVLNVGVAAAQSGPGVIINDIEAAPIEGEAAYEVTAYVTVTDA